MKTFLITVALVAFTASEPPPSNSYLPPPATRSSGYPKGPQVTTPFNAGVPEVVAARSLEGNGQEHHRNGFARNSQHNHDNVARSNANGDHNEHGEINEFGRNTAEDTLNYQADTRGFKPRISYQDAEEINRSGYDSNASNVRSSSSNHGDEFGRNHDKFARIHDEFGRNHGQRSNGY